jgi:hypothetical protein
VEIVKEIGSYAGLAAVFGLAVLSALYFSQARDVKRLRDWAGRAPERAEEQAVGGRAPVSAQPRSVSPAQPVGSQTAQEPARVGAAAPGAVRPAGSGPAAAAALGRTAAAQAAARQAAARGAMGNGPGANGPRGQSPRLPGGQTSILAAPAAADSRRWYRRLPAGRYLALIIAGVLIVGGGAAYGVSKYLQNDSPAVTERTSGGGSGDVGAKGSKRTPVDPASINVAVLNGTSVAGLARTEGDKVDAAGFQLGNVDNAIDKQRAESVVLFAPGRNREARLVARKLGISQIEPADAESRARAPSATVIVIVGADRSRG